MRRRSVKQRYEGFSIWIGSESKISAYSAFHPNYFEEAKYERMVPGTGELPLLDILAALPRDRIVGIEVPLRSQADAGKGPFDRLRPCVDAARDLLARLDALPAEPEE